MLHVAFSIAESVKLQFVIITNDKLIINTGHQNKLRVLYCQSKPAAPKAKSTRHIPQAEDRILDAPDLLDDYCKSSISHSCFIMG